MKPDVKSLSVLKGRHEVSLFGKTAQELFPNLARGGLEDHLVRVLDHRTEASIPDFLQQSVRLFQKFIACIKDHDTTKVEATPSWTLSYAEELMTHLEKLERVYGSDAVKELSDDLLKVTLQCRDAAGRSHVLSLVLSPDTFPQSCPSCTCELPIKSGWQPSWRHGDESMPSKRHKVESDKEEIHLKENGDKKDDGDVGYGLTGLYTDFTRAVLTYQDLWNELDDLDASTWILEPSVRPPCRSVLERRVALTEATSIVIEVDCERPRAPPKTVRWIGADTSTYRKKFEQYMSTPDSGWSMQLSIKDNLERSLGIRLPSPPSETSEVALECSICYTHDLPTEEDGSSEFPDTTCDYLPCGRHYHESCLRDWLYSLPSSRKSFDRLLGTCPYCNEPISAAIQQK
jgi:E3 ubiquitin-protein ligase FANCL